MVLLVHFQIIMSETIKLDNKIVVHVKEENKSCKYFILTNDLFRAY